MKQLVRSVSTHTLLAFLLGVLVTIPLLALTRFCSVVVPNSVTHSQTNPQPRRGSPPATPFRENLYNPIFYHKTHKTGSVTIGRALLRYANRHRLRPCTESGYVYITYPNRKSNTYDIIALQHFPYDLDLIKTYLKRPPSLTVTSIRLPLQRSVSWFRQQNSHLEKITDAQCDSQKDAILKEYDVWVAAGKPQASQYFQLQERGARHAHEANGTKMSAKQIVDQFDFIFVRERFRESFECMCAKTAVRLCDPSQPLKKENAKQVNGCVEKVLLEKRSAALLKGNERDLELYELVEKQLSDCQRVVPEHCRCPES